MGSSRSSTDLLIALQQLRKQHECLTPVLGQQAVRCPIEKLFHFTSKCFSSILPTFTFRTPRSRCSVLEIAPHGTLEYCISDPAKDPTLKDALCDLPEHPRILCELLAPWTRRQEIRMICDYWL